MLTKFKSQLSSQVSPPADDNYLVAWNRGLTPVSLRLAHHSYPLVKITGVLDDLRPDAIFSGELENDDSEPVTKPQPKKTLAATSTPTSSDKVAVPSNSTQSLDVVPDGKFTPQAGSPADDWLALVSL